MDEYEKGVRQKLRLQLKNSKVPFCCAVEEVVKNFHVSMKKSLELTSTQLEHARGIKGLIKELKCVFFW